MTWVVIRLFLTTYWKPLAIGILVLGSWAGLAYWGHTKYIEGKEVGVKIAAQAKLELADEKTAREVDRQNWQSSMLAIQASNKKEVDRQNKIIEVVSKDYKAAKVQLQKKQEARVEQVKAIGSISVPTSFRVFYNEAVSDYYGYQGTKGNNPDSTGTLGKVYTIDPTVVIDNVNQYNKLALKCDKLIDLVKEKEYGTNGP